MKKLFGIIIFLFTLACNSENKLNVDVSDVKITLDYKNLDRELFSINPDSIEILLPKLVNKYGSFLDLFSEQIIKIGNTSQKDYANNLRQFITDLNMRQTYDAILLEYPNTDLLKEELYKAFQHWKYYFPNKKTPTIYTMLSGFNQSVVTDENTLAIGLEMYLSKGGDFYDRLQIPKYLQSKMNKSRILPDCILAYSQMEFPYNDSVDNVMTNMIYQGKLLYLTHAILPQTPDTLLLAYTNLQYLHASKYEERMWKYLIEHKLLFSSDKLAIAKLIGESPFTSYFGNNSAPRAGHFIGYKIVKEYMKNNSNVTIAELMRDNSYEKILQMSAYNPGK